MPASYTAVMEAPRTAGSFKTVRHNARLKRRWTLRCIRRLRIFSPAAQKTPSPDGRAEECRTPGRAARPYQRRTAPNICGGLRIRPPRKRCGDAAAESAVSAEAAARTAAAPPRRRGRRGTAADSNPPEGTNAMIQSHLKAAGRFFTVFLLLVAVMQAAYAVMRLIPFVPEGYEPSRVGALGRRGGGARALFPAGADGHALRPAAAEAYAESGGNRPLRFLLCGVRFWAETAGFALLCLLLPSGWLFAGLPVLLPDRGLCLALLLPLLFLLQLPARLSAFRAFGRMNESREPYAERKAYRGALTRIALGCALAQSAPSCWHGCAAAYGRRCPQYSRRACWRCCCRCWARCSCCRPPSGCCARGGSGGAS